MIPPHSKEIEQAVLGSLMLSRDALYGAMDKLFPEIFYLDSHKEAFEAIQALYDQNQTVDILTVYERVKGGRSGLTLYDLTKMQNQIVGVPVDTYVMMLAELYLKREVGRIGHEAFRLSFEESQDAFDLANSTGNLIEKAQECVLKGNTADLSHFVMQVLLQHSKTKETGVIGLKTGLGFIDDNIGGLVSPDLIILAARPGQGKTALALTITLNLSILAKVPGAWFSLEMDGVQLVRRLISMLSAVDHARIREGRTTPEDETKMQDAAGVISACPLYIEDKPNLNIRDVKTRAHILHKKHKIKYLIVDYLQLMDGLDVRNKSRDTVVSEISRGLKVLAKELSIPVIALSQLNRSVETRADKMPQLSDLRESGAIEQDADEVLFIMRPEYYGLKNNWEFSGCGLQISENGDGSIKKTNENGMDIYIPVNENFQSLAVINVAKNRHGVTGYFPSKFIGSLMKFTDYELVRFKPVVE